MKVCSAWSINAWNASSAASSEASIRGFTSHRSVAGKRGIYRVRLAVTMGAVLIFVSAALASTANAAAPRGWTTAQAAAKLKATYATVDPKAAAVIQANIDQEKAGCQCDTDARIVSLQASLASTQTAAKARSASCRGAGRSVKGHYTRLRCSVKVAGTFRAPPDYVPYSTMKKLTVTVSGKRWRIVDGWR